MDKIETWQRPQVVLYLYLATAFSDFQVVEAEMDLIKSKLPLLRKKFPDISPNITEEMYSFLLGQEQEEIRKTVAYICTRDSWTALEKKQIVDDLEDIIDADGIIRDLELQMLDVVRNHLLSNSSS